MYTWDDLPTQIGPVQLFPYTEIRLGAHIVQFVANPSPTNAPPVNLTMPDFSILPGGWGAGKSVQNLDIWLSVLEEWRDCDVSSPFFRLPALISCIILQPQVGNTISFTANHLIYNVTSTS